MMAADHDMQPHIETWHSFVRTLFCGVGFVVVVLILMALFLL